MRVYKISLVKIFYILMIIFIFITPIYSKCVCFYNSYFEFMTKYTCKLYNQVFEIVFKEKCDLKPLSEFNLNEKYGKVIITGMGHYNGILKPGELPQKEWDNSSLILYKDLVKLDANLLLIDACYAGYIFDYNKNRRVKVIITSTGKENSWNPVYKGRNIGSLALALNCKFNKDFECPINCKELNVNTCQLSLIFYMFYLQQWNFIMEDFYPWEYPSLGTCTINGKPCKNFE